MPSKVHNVVIAGLGGQGVLKASDILAYTAFAAGYDVKKGEVHGMSQRGGSVTSDIRCGDKVLSPMVPLTAADYLVVLDETQIEPARHVLKPGGILLSCAAMDLASLPTPKALNVAMLGMLSVFLDIPGATWHQAIRNFLPEPLHEMNDKAFNIGHTLGEKEKSNA